MATEKKIVALDSESTMSLAPPPSASATFFEHFVCRLGGAPLETIAELRAEAVTARLDEIAHLKRALEAQREPLTEALHTQIGLQPNKDQRGTMIALRRNIFNLREVAHHQVEKLANDLTDELTTGLEAFIELQKTLAEARQDLVRVYGQSLATTRLRLRELIERDDFRGALLLSSRSLHRARSRYLRTPLDRLRARDRQIERGLLRYVTRMVTKATPFSTFCTVIPGRLIEPTDGNMAGALRLTGDPEIKRGMVRLNKAYLTVACEHLLGDVKARRHLGVAANPTVRRLSNGQLVFLSQVGGRETFQRLPDSPALARIRALLTEPFSAITVRNLVHALAALQETDSSEETIVAYIDRLIDIGYIHLTFGVPMQDLDWNRKFREGLAVVGHPRARQVVELFTRLEKLAAAYAVAPSNQKAVVFDQLEDTYNVFKQEHRLAFRVKVPIYEDATSDISAQLPRSQIIHKIENDLRDIVELMSRVTPLRRDLAHLRHFFDHHYDSKTAAVPLLVFHEDFYRHHYKQHLQREAEARDGTELDDGYDLENPFKLDFVRRIGEAHKRMNEMVLSRWRACQDAEEVVFTTEDLRHALGCVEPIPSLAGWSVVFFADLVSDPNGRQSRLAIRNGRFTTGFGKMFSRFLDLFPPDFTAAVQARNSASSQPGELLAELCDDANFNANLHPPLFSAEISYPIGESRSGGRKIMPTELEVVPDARDRHGLNLCHRETGELVLPVETGFMATPARAPLYRLLSMFTPSSSAAFTLPWNLEPHLGDGSRIIVRPRITFNEHITLYRRAWLVPNEAYPLRDDKESDVAYFERVHAWRREHGIPERTYIHFRTHTLSSTKDLATTGTPADTEFRRNKFTDLKPQYIDFASPLLVDLFGRMAPDQKFLAVFEECLPAGDECVSHDQRAWASELILQLDFSQSSP